MRNFRDACHRSIYTQPLHTRRPCTPPIGLHRGGVQHLRAASWCARRTVRENETGGRMGMPRAPHTEGRQKIGANSHLLGVRTGGVCARTSRKRATGHCPALAAPPLRWPMTCVRLVPSLAAPSAQPPAITALRVACACACMCQQAGGTRNLSRRAHMWASTSSITHTCREHACCRHSWGCHRSPARTPTPLCRRPAPSTSYDTSTHRSPSGALDLGVLGPHRPCSSMHTPGQDRTGDLQSVRLTS